MLDAISIPEAHNIAQTIEKAANTLFGDTRRRQELTRDGEDTHARYACLQAACPNPRTN
jgi:hypothetical protein